MAEYSRGELEKMVELFTQAIAQAETSGDWVEQMGCMYTDDALYQWNVGPNEEFCAHGRKEIEAYAMGAQMEGLKEWRYPYYDFVIDEERGEVIGFFRQISPAKREDGTNYEVEGVSGSRFYYGGNYQWREQRDFFDVGNLRSLLIELAGIGELNPQVKRKIRQFVRGEALAGNRHIRPAPSLFKKCVGIGAILKIAITGR